MIKTKLVQTTRQFAKISNIRKFSNISKLSEADKNDKKTTTHFGFQQIPEDIKETLVGKVFSNVADKYDVMNDAMSLGIHRLWKDYFIKAMAPAPGSKLIDVAGGTGDIATKFLEYCRDTHGDHTAHATVVDINADMLRNGKKRFQLTEFVKHDQAEFILDNGEKLENIPDNSMDIYTISFGIRNCTHIDQVIKQAYRVLKPGGKLMVLEFSHVDNPVVSPFYDLYSFQVIPALGSLIASDSASYQYLVESIRKFPTQEKFAQMIRDEGFVTLGKGYENLTFGVAAIHTGYKL